MTLCRLMQLDFKGQLTDYSPEEAYSIYNLKFGISYARGWLDLGYVRDEVGDFDLEEFLNWCINKLNYRIKILKMIQKTSERRMRMKAKKRLNFLLPFSYVWRHRNK